MSEEPQLPPIPAVGAVIDRKDSYEARKYSVLKCHDCGAKYQRKFTEGDYTFKNLQEESCNKCSSRALTIEEIFCEWYDPKKDKVYINKHDL